MNIFHLLLVGAGGCAGSMARYATVMAFEKRLNSAFPYGTFCVNIAGSFLLGFILAWIAARTDTHNEPWKLLLGTGFCGGFTTFSAFTAENAALLDQKLASTALLYIALSVAGGLVAVWIGFALSRTLFQA